MELKVLGTGSKGNCYVMTASNGENIIIEQGLRFPLILEAMGHDLSKTICGLCTHLHKDHSKGTKDLMAYGIDVLIAEGEYRAVGVYKKPGGEHIRGFEHRAKFIKHGQKYTFGNWEIWAFKVNHDTPEPLGFLIRHPECGLTLFLTDTYYIENTFDGLNNIIIEANFCETIMQERFDAGYLQAFLRDRIYKSHLSLTSCLEVLKSNNLRSVNNILLIHLSDSNSHAERFQETVYKATLKNVTVAKAGLNLKWNKTPFG